MSAVGATASGRLSTVPRLARTALGFQGSAAGRALTAEEAREVTHIARRLAALILLQPELDANYLRAKAASHSWPA